MDALTYNFGMWHEAVKCKITGIKLLKYLTQCHICGSLLCCKFAKLPMFAMFLGNEILLLEVSWS